MQVINSDGNIRLSFEKKCFLTISEYLEKQIKTE